MEEKNMKNFEKVVKPCECEVYAYGKNVFKPAYAKIEYTDGRLSISGVVAPRQNGNCFGSAGQCSEEIRIGTPIGEWTEEMLKKFCDIWDRWHLNDARPYCTHMKELGWDEQAKEKVKIMTYNLTKEACDAKETAKKRAIECLKKGQPFYPTKDEIAYANMPYSIKVYNDEETSYDKSIYRDAYEYKEKDVLGHSNTEYETRGWISYDEHPLGFIGRPCPTCGYEYGTAWKTEEVPEEVLEFLEGLPDDTCKEWNL